jgi:hypothetical protein
MMIMKDESGIDDVREGGTGVRADFHCLFDASAFQCLLDSRHKLRSFGSGASSVIEESFQKDGDGQERAEKQDIHRKTTDLNDLQNCFPSKHLSSPLECCISLAMEGHFVKQYYSSFKISQAVWSVSHPQS